MQLFQSIGTGGPWRSYQNQTWKGKRRIKRWRGTHKDSTGGPGINHHDQLGAEGPYATKQNAGLIASMLHNGSGRLLILIAAGWGIQWELAWHCTDRSDTHTEQLCCYSEHFRSYFLWLLKAENITQQKSGVKVAPINDRRSNCHT